MATPSPIYRYPLDGTGKSPDNLVVGEEHQLSNRTIRCITPTYGGFFAESVLVKDLATQLPLIYGVDYNFGEMFEFPTGRYGKEIWGIIIIKKPLVTKVSINYQALGGDYSYSMDALINMVDNLNLGERPTEWGMIVGRPALYNPASHFHDVGDVYGFEYVVHAIDLLRQAILTGDVASHDEIYRYIDNIMDGQQNSVAAVMAALNAHIANKANPHGTTKTHVGLGNVENYPPATNAIALTGTSTAHYVTPASLIYAIEQKSGKMINDHIADKNNPHGTTKTHVGLSNVNNYSTATPAETTAGVSENQHVTPKGLRTAVSAWNAAGDFDGRYVRYNAPNVIGSINIVNDVAFVWAAGGWKQFWPPVWQA